MPRSKDDIRTIGALKLQREAMRDHCFRLENKIVERDERIAELLAEVERLKKVNGELRSELAMGVTGNMTTLFNVKCIEYNELKKEVERLRKTPDCQRCIHNTDGDWCRYCIHNDNYADRFESSGE